MARVLRFLFFEPFADGAASPYPGRFLCFFFVGSARASRL
jgi:hypothetical protein